MQVLDLQFTLQGTTLSRCIVEFEEKGILTGKLEQISYMWKLGVPFDVQQRESLQ